MRALITGITGQDGSYLAEFLLDNGYEVHGVIRRTSSFSTGRIDHIFDRLTLHYGDLTDATAIEQIVATARPDEVYNLGAQSHVRISFDLPLYTYQTIALGTLALLDACRRLPKPPKFYQASSSEMFGSSPPPQSEATPFRPRSPYACAKVAAFHQVVNYREAYGMFACNGILFNHESPRRGETFVTRKITRALANIEAGQQKTLYLGNLAAKRDWGHARDYVRAMWLMLQAVHPSDYVIATGRSHSVQEFVERAFASRGLYWRDFVKIDERLKRPAEVDHLQGDCGEARRLLGWRPAISFDDLVEEMVEADRCSISRPSVYA